MFMPYFWISCAVQPRGKIPLFVELRKFNELSYEDFSSFIFGIAVDSQEQTAKNLFKAAIEDAQFVFIFDGYDEIDPKKRQAAEAAILKLGEHKNIVIVSGRPDELFHSWQSFTCYSMMPFTLEKTSLL